jgi:hypothetical protein
MSVKDQVAYAASLTDGALLWIATAKIAGRTEAWDAPMYWTVTYPLAIVLAGALGFLVPRRPWRWALAVFLAQPVVLAASASSFGLMPLGLMPRASTLRNLHVSVTPFAHNSRYSTVGHVPPSIEDPQGCSEPSFRSRPALQGSRWPRAARAWTSRRHRRPGCSP